MSGYKNRFKKSVLDAPRVKVTVSVEREQELILGARQFDYEGQPKERDIEAVIELLTIYGQPIRKHYKSVWHEGEEARNDRVMSVTEVMFRAVDKFIPGPGKRLNGVFPGLLTRQMGKDSADNGFGVPIDTRNLVLQLIEENGGDPRKAVEKGYTNAEAERVRKENVEREKLGKDPIKPSREISRKEFWLVYRTLANVAPTSTLDEDQSEIIEGQVEALFDPELEQKRREDIADAYSMLEVIDYLDEDGNVIPDRDPDARLIVELYFGFRGDEMVVPGVMEEVYGSNIEFSVDEIRLILENLRGVRYVASQIRSIYGKAMTDMRVNAGIIPAKRTKRRNFTLPKDATPIQKLGYALIVQDDSMATAV